ncbi:MAG: InlB B-repeat-containing protein [Clostridia bacterium]|nr:InlB B-repeat-containing protein [Clostridia bacterium]
MKKRWIILISNILSILLIIICLSGCSWFNHDEMGQYDDPWDYKKQEGEFYYYIDKWRYGEDMAIILDLTYEGQEREELVIPETLGGYPVGHIGASHGRRSYYGMKCNNVKKITINHFTAFCQYSFIEFYGTLVFNSEQEYRNIDNYHGDAEPMLKNVKAVYINVPRDIDNHYTIYRLFNWLYESHYGIIFHANGDEVATSGIINRIENDLELPEEPTKQGYKFVDWFTDIDCSEAWNPDDSISGKKVTDVYAKWIEI